MSGHNEVEEVKVAPVNVEPGALLNNVNDARNTMSAKDYGATLAAFNKDATSSLPSLELMDAKADVPPPPEIKLAGTSDKDLASDGIKRSHGTNENGKETTSTEFPNGVKISTDAGGATTIMEDGTKVTMGPGMVFQAGEAKLHEHPKGSGAYFDKHNQEVFTDNKDGSYTVFTKTGAYTAREDGTVTKEAAIKNRDGSFTVLDTNDPLGGLDMAPLKYSH